MRPNLPAILDDGISHDQKGQLLADKAVGSLTDEQYARQRDGIQYLADNVDQGINTILTDA